MTERPLRAAERNSNAEILASPAMESPRAELLLFKNITFFLSAHVPERSWCTQLIDVSENRSYRLDLLAEIAHQC